MLVSRFVTERKNRVKIHTTFIIHVKPCNTLHRAAQTTAANLKQQIHPTHEQREQSRRSKSIIFGTKRQSLDRFTMHSYLSFHLFILTLSVHIISLIDAPQRFLIDWCDARVACVLATHTYTHTHIWIMNVRTHDKLVSYSFSKI